MNVAQRYASIVERVEGACRRTGRDPAKVRILGACKKMDPERVRLAYEAGLRLVGENRLQEAVPRMEALSDLREMEWHFIGALQSRKCREVAGAFAAVQSVDREKVARLLDRHAAETGRRLPVLLEVNVGGEASKAGCEPEEAGDLLLLCAELANLEPQGLMNLPPHTDDPEGSRPFHRRLREIRDRLRDETGLALPVLSMGMSHDLEVAVEEGSTIVRVGTALFGPRPS